MEFESEEVEVQDRGSASDLLEERGFSIPRLRAQVKGRVIAPGDHGCDRARAAFYSSFDRRPAVIVRPADADDVARVISLARETGLELAVRSGGHSFAGHSGVHGGIVLDLADMRMLQIDAEARTAWAETGLTAGEYTAAAGAYGLATGFGDTPTVGIGGITLGGGVGYLARKLGMTIDQLLAAEVVTADGRLLRADAETHPDLFWALRGGGGNFGVATRFQFRLHEIDTILGGMLILPATPEVIHAFVAEAEAAPDELSTIANVMPAPPLPFLPAQMHGRLVLMAMMAYAGAVKDGQRAVAPFRALTAPIADLLRPMHYPEMFAQEEGGVRPVAAATRTVFVNGVDRDAARMIIERLRASQAPMRFVQLRALGGAIARVPADATAYAHRGQRVMASIAVVYDDIENRPLHEAWAADFAAALQPQDAGTYVNFMGDEGQERVRAAYPGAAWDRLAAVKARYDPDNLFHLNQNIPPASRDD